jgi:glycosyltransferase involved in cell wall biosynthesis
MKIAVNIRPLFKNNAGSLFLIECIQRIAANYPAHHFIIITDRQLDESVASLKNISTIIIDTEITNPLLAKLWYNYKLPAIAKKYKANILINGDGICSLHTKIPQLLIVQRLGFLHSPKFVSKKELRLYKKNTEPSLKKARKILTTSQSVKKDIIEQYKINEDKIDVANTGINQLFKPIDWKEKEAIKEKYSEGKEFFLFYGSLEVVDNLITLLKAFSFFKKRQKSNMQLIIAINELPKKESFTESLKTYKYRNEVKLLQNLSEEERAKITAAAYAFVYPSYQEDAAATLLEPLRCEVPVIISDNVVFYETCADAALYVNPNHQEDIADKLMLVFKDEKKRSELIEKGKEISGQYSWDKTAAVVWEAILKTVQE